MEQKRARNNLSVRSQHSSCLWWWLINRWNGAQNMCCFFLWVLVTLKCSISEISVIYKLMIIVLCTLYFNKSFINVRLNNLGEGKNMYDHQIEDMP